MRKLQNTGIQESRILVLLSKINKEFIKQRAGTQRTGFPKIQKSKIQNFWEIPKMFLKVSDFWMFVLLDFSENCVPALCFINSLLSLLNKTKILDSWIPVF